MKIMLTGGGTAGHVMPHLALLEDFRNRGWELVYVGTKGIERELALQAGIRFTTIYSGKLRRYWSWQNFLDVFRLLLGIAQSIWIVGIERPSLVFSKGGFVSVPVALAAYLWRIPVVTHESDLSPGLANRIIGRFARTILYAFPGTAAHLRGKNSELVGIPVRASLSAGEAQRGLNLCSFEADDPRPVVLVMGGSLGAESINTSIRALAPKLCPRYRLIHITGRGKSSGLRVDGYKEFEYVKSELADLIAAAKLVVSRAGANALFELLALEKPMLLIPLERGSRGDQLENAADFAKHGWAEVLRERDLSAATLAAAIDRGHEEGAERIAKMKGFAPKEAAPKILAVLARFAIKELGLDER